MSLFNTINFLPEVFRTDANKAFLNSTMDQLVADSVNVTLNGYIGRTFAPTYKLGDNYVPEINNQRKYYQLEPSVVVKNKKNEVIFKSNYIDLLHSIASNYGLNNNHQRLFSSESYSYDSKFNYDKFVNYFNYYWLPTGPDAVNVYGNQVPYQADYTVTRDTNDNGYIFSNLGNQPNTILTLARGGTYTFKIDQPGYKFWIQSQPGASGTVPGIPTLSSRTVFGVTNNGIDSGIVTFKVPLTTSQNFYLDMSPAAKVNVAVDNFAYTDIQNQLLSTFLANFPNGLDGIKNQFAGKTFIFINNNKDDSLWTTPSMPTGLSGLDTSDIRPGSVIPVASRTGGWIISLVAVNAIDPNTDYVIQLHPEYVVTPQQKVFVSSGLVYSGNQFWIDNNYNTKVVPAVTANKEYLYYQDSANPDFVGQIKLVDNIGSTINVDKDILGQIGYTSPNGVIFTNGIKIAFDTSVTPASYAGAEYYVDGVGTGISLTPVSQLVVSEPYGVNIETAPDYITINRSSRDQNGWSRYNRWFHKDVLIATANYNQTLIDYGPNIPARRPIIEFDPNLQLFNYGSSSINNVDVVIFANPVANIISGGTYNILSVGTTDFTSFGATSNTVGTTFTATKNGTTSDGNGITTTDAFNQVEGQATVTANGTTLLPGDTILFANDYDTNITDKIYSVEVDSINGSNFIRLVDTGIRITTGTNVLVVRGNNKGISYYFDGIQWHQGQEKTSVNQTPLFDLIDANGYSFSNTTVYPFSTFAGSQIFSYARNTGTINDSVLGFPLVYQTFNNVGDIVFNNYYDTDTFVYTENNASVTVNCSSGYFAINTNNGILKENNWVANIEPTRQYQIFTKFYDGHILTIDNKEYAFVQIDVLPDSNQKSIPYLKVFLNNKLLKINIDYIVAPYGVYHIIQLFSLPTIGDKIDVEIYSSSTSTLGYYKIPDNLDLNPLNETFSTLTLGQVRTHYNKLIENYSGSRVTQDVYLKAQGGTIAQQSSPVIYSATFLNDPTINFINGIDLARKEYTRFKNKFLSLCSSLTTLDYNNPTTGVDTILEIINSTKNSSFPWYYSDMVPQGGNFTTLTYTVLNANQKNYELNSIFNNLVLSNRAVIIYHNGVQLVSGTDYSFSQQIPAVTINIALSVGDTVVIRDYFNTDGNYIPETPSKLGLYPKFQPEIYLDNTYQTPLNMIKGHDGSITPAFNDFRDQYLLELELRIYNNIKINYNLNELNRYDIIPGRFRSSDYSLAEFNQLLSKNFLHWIGSNSVDYTTNTYYDSSNPWTWNYAGLPDSIDGTLLSGSWRAIFRHWFDTDRPNLAPWEMLGFSSIPNWWIDRYGPAPYTSGNTTLWEDLEAGYVYNAGSPYTDARFVRPGLNKFIPVDESGNLIDPSSIPLYSKFSSKYTNGSFAIGQQGPVENAWRNSSDFPYAMQVAFALAKPAEYFATQLDNSLFYKNNITGQFSASNNNKITPSMLTINGLTVNGVTNRTSGYINWIADVVKNLGIDPTVRVAEYFKNMSVQLSYKVAGFTDQSLITVSAEQTTPGSKNASVIIPNENYKIYLGKSVPVSSLVYSGVIVERVVNGYSVSGFDAGNPFFNIIPSVSNNNSSSITVGNISAKIYNEHLQTVTVIPYGTEFTSAQQVVDFLVSYQRYLTAVGFVLTDYNSDLGRQQDFILSAEEFLYWAQQGWENNTIIVLNPVTSKLKLLSTYTVVDEITNSVNGCRLLDQNFTPIKTSSITIVRDSIFDPSQINPTNVFTLNIINGTSVCLARLNLVQYEHVLIFDNVDNFGDIIYIPSQGTRQYRLKLTGEKTGAWNGMLSATGYVYSNPTIIQWQINYDYKVGDIITFGGNYYTAPADIPANSKFDVTQWIQIQYSDIQTGLLPSLGHNAQKFVNYYDVDNPPQEKNLQLFSAGLIGFRERPYLTDLGISIPNQTKFYQGFVKQKGSVNSIQALTKAEFDNVQGTISTYEEWGFLVGKYGDFSRNQYKEFILNQSIFNTNPIAFTSSTVYETGNIIVQLNGNAASVNSNIYTAGNLTSTVTSLYDNRSDIQYMSDLPTAGYVHLDDIDTRLFDIASATSKDVLSVGAGHKLWVAKDSNNHWNVFRITETRLTATLLSYVLNAYGQLNFDGVHDFSPGDTIVLTNFNTTYGNYNGVYKVINVPNSTSVTVIISPGNGNNLLYLVQNSPLSATGTVYALKSMVVNSVADINNITPLAGWVNNDRVWVNNATANGWGVYTYNRPWLSNTVSNITPNTISTNSYFGSAVKINTATNYVYTGSPGSQQVFANAINSSSANITVSNTYAGFGSTIESQGNLLVVGAPATSTVAIYFHNASANTITKIQTIQSPNAAGKFGTSIAMSSDQKWLYVGEPSSNVVQAYTTTTFGSSAVYSQIATIQPVFTGIGNVGQIVKTNNTGANVYIGAPGATNSVLNNGNVYVYNRSINVFTQSQTLSSQTKNSNANFGASLDVDRLSGNLFIGIPGSTHTNSVNGIVERYVYSNGTYVFNQYINNPSPDSGNFGSAVKISSDSMVLAVSGSSSSGKESTIFDANKTTIDASSTLFVDTIFNSGAAFLFEPLLDKTVVGTLGNYVYTQDLETQVYNKEQFGAAIDVTRNLISVGAPGAYNNRGGNYLFNNNQSLTTWQLSRQAEPQVDITSINRTFIYNKTNNNILTSLDFVDPKKGKLLNSVGKDIDYFRQSDPAVYNFGKGSVVVDRHWGPEQTGKIWWDISSISYIEYEQGELIYRLNHWGEFFPGSTVNVYQWIESMVLPSQYVANGGSGSPLHADDSQYSTYGWVDQSGGIHVKYYFWITMSDQILHGKTNSVISIKEGILNPHSQAVTYFTPLRNDTVALYNVNSMLTGTNSVLHLSKQTEAAGLIHSEYTLVQEGNPASKIPSILLSKLIDSLAKQDAAGLTVPDSSLSPAQAYGINVTPRQGMFVNPALALSNYIDIVNFKLLSYPVAERKVLTLLNSGQTIPPANSGAYSITVATIDELTYVDTSILSVGYKVLILNDSTHLGKWAIYTWSGSSWSATTIQSYKTNASVNGVGLYWYYVDYYSSTFNPTTTINVTVANKLDFGKLTLVANTYVKILDTGLGNFAIYYIDNNLTPNLVGIQNGTIQITTDIIPSLELRQILYAIQTQILIDDLATDFNQVFFTLVKYALTEQKNLDWVFKTSFLNVNQQIRKLQQFPAYIADNQNYYLDYVQEVKPYRTVLREFVVDYIGNDTYGSDVTDFDIPPYWDANLNIYRAPNGEQSYDNNKLNSGIYTQWTNNHTYGVVDIVIDNPGSGYTFPPEIIVTGGGANVRAVASSTVWGNGAIKSVTVNSPGVGYTSTPTITVNGTGSGAILHPILRNVFDNNQSGHNLVRSIATTIKFDRINYTTANNFVFWSNVSNSQIGTTILADTILVLGTDLYKLVSSYTVDSNLTFPVANVVPINIGTFNNANDRIVAKNGNINLAATQLGIEYPGVKVDGNTFTGNIYDSSISSSYAGTIGIAPNDIIVDGGAYYDRYNSHAPEELVPGITYDSLNLKVFEANVDANISFRIFKDMSGKEIYTRISNNAVTALAANLHITDSNIYVTNTSVLPVPDPTLGIPGIIFVNGEKITYYTVDNVNHVLGQIRRAVDGTGAPEFYANGTIVVDSSIVQQIPNTVFNSNVLLSNTTTYKSTSNVSLNLKLTTPITANVGDHITQLYSDNNIAANLLVIGNVTTSNTVPVIVYSGAITTLTNTVNYNGTAIHGNVLSTTPIGSIFANGNVIVSAGTTVQSGQTWYDIDTAGGYPSYGNGLTKSATIQAKFLLSTPGYIL